MTQEFHLGRTLKNIASMRGTNIHEIEISINSYKYWVTDLYLSGISNKFRNQIIIGGLNQKYEFNCIIKDGNTYKYLDGFFKGEYNQNLLTDSVITDLCEVGTALECDDLIEWFCEKFEIENYKIENFEKIIIYSNIKGINNKLYDFICQNLKEIGIKKVVDACIKIGYDFAEQLIMSCQKNNIDISELFTSLIETNSSFLGIILNVDINKVDFSTKNRYTKALFSSLSSWEVVDQSLLKFMSDKVVPSMQDDFTLMTTERNEMNAKAGKLIINLKKETKIFNDINQKLTDEKNSLTDENKKLQEDKTTLTNQVNELTTKIKQLEAIEGETKFYYRVPFDGITKHFGNYEKKIEVENGRDSWTYDFKNMRVSIQGFSISFRISSGNDISAEGSYEIFASNDMSSWEKIREIKFSGQNETRSFSNNVPITPFYRYIRIKQRYVSCYYPSSASLTDFEIFGSIDNLNH